MQAGSPHSEMGNTENKEEKPRQDGGFYGSQFSALEVRDLSDTSSHGLRDEIALLKVAIRRFVEQTLASSDDFEDGVKLLNTLGSALGRLARLVVSNRKLEGDQSEDSALQKALKEVLQRIQPGIEEEDLD